MKTNVLALIAILAGCATAAPPADERPGSREQRLTELRAVVSGVDQPRRLLALESDDGAIAVLPVAEAFRDFEKLRVGDPVVVDATKAGKEALARRIVVRPPHPTN